MRDLKESRELLGDVLGRRVDLLAYPRGKHDEHVRAAAEKAGFSHAFGLPEEAERPETSQSLGSGSTAATVPRLCESRPRVRTCGPVFIRSFPPPGGLRRRPVRRPFGRGARPDQGLVPGQVGQPVDGQTAVEG